MLPEVVHARGPAEGISQLTVQAEFLAELFVLLTVEVIEITFLTKDWRSIGDFIAAEPRWNAKLEVSENLRLAAIARYFKRCTRHAHARMLP